MNNKEKILWWIAVHLPREIKMLCYILVIAHATAKVYPDKTPNEITFDMVCHAWDKNEAI